MNLEQKICWKILKNDSIWKIFKDFQLEENSSYYIKEVNHSK